MTRLSASERFRAWAGRTQSGSPLSAFRIFFAAVWLIYDVIDLYTGQTAHVKLSYYSSGEIMKLQICIAVLVFCELGLLSGYKPRWFALAAFGARAYELTYLSLNDFAYFCVMALLFSVAESERGKKETLAWPVQVMILQTAWIYFMSAMTKLNPEFLSGGDLFVRHNYTAIIFSYPEFYRNVIASLPVNAVLAWGAVIMEFTLATMLFCKAVTRRKYFGDIAVVLVIAIHTYAAVTLNVFFFGVSMIGQVYFLVRDR